MAGFLVLALAVLSGGYAIGAGPEVRATQSGLVRGRGDGATWTFQGIPYAAPPIGARRWTAPAPVANWDGTRDTRSFGDVCAQISVGGLMAFVTGDKKPPKVVGKEDCLTLNVWTPKRATSPLPVMFFLHGGGNESGASSDELFGNRFYDGKNLATKGNAVVVSINYRLGALGFLAHPALARADGAVGNYALLDQIAALHWVRDNISAFGGDRDRVLLFGESAGALDTLMLYTSPLAKGLFSRALLQSVQSFTPYETKQVAVKNAETYSHALGCNGASDDVVACLRAKTTDELLFEKTSNGLATPTVDGVMFPESPEQAIKTGHQNNVPLVMGENANELSYIWPSMVKSYGATWPPKSQDDLADHLTRVFTRPLAELVAVEYGKEHYATPADTEIAVASDFAMVCPANRIARAAHTTQHEPVWQYLYNHVYGDSQLSKLGAAHAFELPMVFGNFPVLPYSIFVHISKEEHELSEAMMGYWSRFAADGNPNGAGAPTWPEMTPESNGRLDIDLVPQAGSGDYHHCGFWASHQVK